MIAFDRDVLAVVVGAADPPGVGYENLVSPEVSAAATAALDDDVQACWGRADQLRTDDERNAGRAKCLNDYFDRFWIIRRRK